MAVLSTHKYKLAIRVLRYTASSLYSCKQDHFFYADIFNLL